MRFGLFVERCCFRNECERFRYGFILVSCRLFDLYDFRVSSFRGTFGFRVKILLLSFRRVLIVSLRFDGIE